MYCATGEQIKQIDAYVTASEEITVGDLMARVGEAACDCALELLAGRGKAAGDCRLVILTGPGNNGGDGYAMALECKDIFASVDVFALFPVSAHAEAARSYAVRAKRSRRISVLPWDAAMFTELLSPDTLVVDAVFGIGASRPEPRMAQIARAVKAAGCPVLAIDLPSGVDADTGEVYGAVLPADMTLSLTFPKLGAFAYPACLYCGQITVCDLDLDTEDLQSRFALASPVLAQSELAALLPARPADAHKGNMGRLLAVAGSETYPGAGLLATEAALFSGVGMTVLSSDPSVLAGALPRMPEAVFLPLFEDAEKCKEILADADRTATATLFGSGAGRSARTDALTLFLASRETDRPLILDGDALTAAAQMGSVFWSAVARPLILTPHPAEMARLLGISAADLQAHRIPYAKQFARAHGVTLVLKGMRTVVTDGDTLHVDILATEALAKAGSGDVLAGLISAYAAMGLSLTDACILGVSLHGLAGARLSARYGVHGVRPSELPRSAAEAAKELAEPQAGADDDDIDAAEPWDALDAWDARNMLHAWKASGMWDWRKK